MKSSAKELYDFGPSPNALSESLDVPVNRVMIIFNGQRGVATGRRTPAWRVFRDDIVTMAKSPEDVIPGCSSGANRKEGAGP